MRKRANLSSSIIQGCRLWPDGGLQQDGGLLWDLWRQQLLSKEVWLDRGRLVPLLKTLWRRLQNGQISVSKYSDSRDGGGWFLQSIGKTRFADGPLQRPPLSRQVSPEYLAFHWLKGQGKKMHWLFHFSDGRLKTGSPVVNRVEVAFGAVSSNVLLTRTEKRFR